MSDTPKLPPERWGPQDRLFKIGELAEQVMRRLDGGEPTSAVLAAARRMANLAGREDQVWWLVLELMGLQDFRVTYPAPHPGPRQEGVVKFMRLRSAPQFQNYDFAAWQKEVQGGGNADRSSAVAAPLAQLETIEPPVTPGVGASMEPGADSTLLEQALALLPKKEGQLAEG